jgi:hypothetical protein
MTAQEKIEELKFIIGRFDHYFDSVNNKGNLYLGVNTFFFGGTLAVYSSYLENQTFSSCIWYMVLIPAFICNLMSFIHTLRAVNPYTRKHSTTNSILFFGDVKLYSDEDWSERWNNLDETKWNEDLKCQAHVLAAGLQRKFRRLTFATYFTGAQVALLFLFGIYYFITHKTQ